MGWIDRIRENSRVPAQPIELALAFAFVFIFGPLAAYPFIVERVIIGDPAWLPADRADLLISEFLFGSYDQAAYGNFVLACLVALAGLGALASYGFLRRFLGRMKRVEAIPNAALIIPLLGDLPIGYILSAAIAAVLGQIAGAGTLAFPGVLTLESFLGVSMFVGFVVGSSTMKCTVAVWWQIAISRKPIGNSTRV